MRKKRDLPWAPKPRNGPEVRGDNRCLSEEEDPGFSIHFYLTDTFESFTGVFSPFLPLPPYYECNPSKLNAVRIACSKGENIYEAMVINGGEATDLLATGEQVPVPFLGWQGKLTHLLTSGSFFTLEGRKK